MARIGGVPTAIALGSNLGNREQSLRQAVDALRGFITDIKVSDFHETAPVGVGEQPPFLNGVVVGRATVPAPQLMQALLDIERELGRERPYPGAPRTIDLDLILYGDAVIEEPALTVPHPRFRERQFVLEPLAQVAGDWVDPVTGRTVAELLESL